MFCVKGESMGYLLIGIELLIFFIFARKGHINAFKVFFLFNIFQNLFLIVFSQQMTGSLTTIAILIKELIIYVSCLIYWRKEKIHHINIFDCFFLAFVVYSLINLILFKPDFQSSIVSLRQFMIPYTCFYFGSFLYQNNEDDNKIIKYIIRIMVPVCLISLILFFFDPEKLWESIGYQRFWINKTGDLSTYATINFYTFDFGFRLQRIVSLLVDPLAFAHLIALVIMLYYAKGRGQKKYYILFGLCALLCFSKYHIIVVLTFLFWFVYTSCKNQKTKRIYRIGVLLIFVSTFIFLWIQSLNTNNVSSITNHFGSLVYSLKNMTLFGNGLGTSGWNSALYGNAAIDSAVTESLFATIMSQVGVIGTVIYYSGLVWMISKSYNLFNKYHNNVDFAMLVLLSALTIETLVSASSISLLGSGVYFIIAGLEVEKYHKDSLLANSSVNSKDTEKNNHYDVLFVDFMVEDPHKLYCDALVKCINKYASTVFIGKKDYVSYQPDDNHKIFPIKTKEIIGNYPIKARINVIYNYYKSKKVFDEYSFDKVVVLGYDPVMFSFMYSSLLELGEVFLVEHHQLDEVIHSKWKIILFNLYKKKVKHILLDESIVESTMNGFDLDKNDIFVFPAPMINNTLIKEKKFGSQNINVLCISRSNDTNQVMELIEFETKTHKLSQNQICVTLRDGEYKSTEHKSCFVSISGYLSDEEFNRLYSDTDFVLMPFPKDFEYRCSGTLVDALSMGKRVICSRMPETIYYEQKYPTLCYTYDTISCLPDIIKRASKDISLAELNQFKEMHNQEYDDNCAKKIMSAE